jgi:hypothetical protein
MHPLILGAGLLAAGSVCQIATAGCPAPGAPVVEHFITAGCADCWAADAPVPPGSWRFDWIAPGADDAPLSAAALPDAAERLQRLGAQPGVRNQAGRGLPGLQLKVGAGPAWQGYFGLQLQVQARSRAALPPGATGWLALVELLPPGSEVNNGQRELVRSVAGPLTLDGAGRPKGITQLRALRWPTGARPERLQARGWIEAADGSLLAVAAQRCP